MCVCLDTCGGHRTTCCCQFSFYHVNPEGGTQVISLGSNSFTPSQHCSPILDSLLSYCFNPSKRSALTAANFLLHPEQTNSECLSGRVSSHWAMKPLNAHLLCPSTKPKVVVHSCNPNIWSFLEPLSCASEKNICFTLSVKPIFKWLFLKHVWDYFILFQCCSFF